MGCWWVYKINLEGNLSGLRDANVRSRFARKMKNRFGYTVKEFVFLVPKGRRWVCVLAESWRIYELRGLYCHAHQQRQAVPLQWRTDYHPWLHPWSYTGNLNHPPSATAQPGAPVILLSNNEVISLPRRWALLFGEDLILKKCILVFLPSNICFLSTG